MSFSIRTGHCNALYLLAHFACIFRWAVSSRVWPSRPPEKAHFHQTCIPIPTRTDVPKWIGQQEETEKSGSTFIISIPCPSRSNGNLSVQSTKCLTDNLTKNRTSSWSHRKQRIVDHLRDWNSFFATSCFTNFSDNFIYSFKPIWSLCFVPSKFYKHQWTIHMNKCISLSTSLMSFG